MFCPNSIDWGNVADWISGLGTLAAVATALAIAINEHRVAARHRQESDNQEHSRRAQIIAEAIRLAGEVEALARQYAQLVSLGGGESSARKREAADGIDGLRNQLLSLQQFPMSDPRLFAEIGRTAADCRPEASLGELSSSYVGIVMTQLTARMTARRAALSAL